MMRTPQIYSIARRLAFDGPQSNYFGVAPATATPMQVERFVGSTRDGGSCNASELTLNPHCHGTHTEGIGHVVDERRDVIDVIPLRPVSARLVTLAGSQARDTNDRCAEATRPEDAVLTAAALRQALSGHRLDEAEALVVRTLPNGPDKATAHYTDSADYPFFTHSAMSLIVNAGIRHLAIDTPSLDRLDDGGMLAVHRQFWRLPRSGHGIGPESRADATVTEMIHVPAKSPMAAGCSRSSRHRSAAMRCPAIPS